MQDTLGRDVGVATQTPLQGSDEGVELGPAIVGVHVEPVGQALAAAAIVHAISGGGGGVGVATQTPPQDPLLPAGGQVMVGVQVEPVGQTPPTVQGIWDGVGVTTEIQSPLQTNVCVQVEPGGQG
jgi:hypothetical protein